MVLTPPAGQLRASGPWYGTGERGLICSRRYNSTSDENLAYFRKPRLAFVVLVALDNGDPVIALTDCKLGSRGECVGERRCDIIGPNDPYTLFGFAQGADRREEAFEYTTHPIWIQKVQEVWE